MSVTYVFRGGRKTPPPLIHLLSSDEAKQNSNQRLTHTSTLAEAHFTELRVLNDPFYDCLHHFQRLTYKWSTDFPAFLPNAAFDLFWIISC